MFTSLRGRNNDAAVCHCNRKLAHSRGKPAWLRSIVAGAVAYLGLFAGSCGNPPSLPVVADPMPGTATYTEPCNNIAQAPQISANTIAIYAEHVFPNITAAELAARVTVIIDAKYDIGPYTSVIGPDHVGNAIMVSDGRVGFLCGVQDQPLEVDQVTFVFR